MNNIRKTYVPSAITGYVQPVNTIAEIKAKYEAEVQEYNRKMAEYKATHPDTVEQTRHVNPHTAINTLAVSASDITPTVRAITKHFGL